MEIKAYVTKKKGLDKYVVRKRCFILRKKNQLWIETRKQPLEEAESKKTFSNTHYKN